MKKVPRRYPVDIYTDLKAMEGRNREGQVAGNTLSRIVLSESNSSPKHGMCGFDVFGENVVEIWPERRSLFPHYV